MACSLTMKSRLRQSTIVYWRINVYLIARLFFIFVGLEENLSPILWKLMRFSHWYDIEEINDKWFFFLHYLFKQVPTSTFHVISNQRPHYCRIKSTNQARRFQFWWYLFRYNVIVGHDWCKNVDVKWLLKVNMVKTKGLRCEYNFLKDYSKFSY